VKSKSPKLIFSNVREKRKKTNFNKEAGMKEASII
jgi:hypothetical protein